MKNYIITLDLGTNKITMVIGEKTLSDVHIIAYQESPSRGVVQGEVLNSVRAGEVLKVLADDLHHRTGIDITDVYVGLGGRHICCIRESAKKMRSNPSVKISQQEVDSLIQDMYNIRVDADKKVLDVIPQIYRLDNSYTDINPVGAYTRQLDAEFCVLAGSEFSMKRIQDTLEYAGLKLKGWLLNPIASATSVLYQDEKDMGVAVVDIGAGTTDVVVYCNGVMRHIAVIPFGSNVITEDIRQGCGIALRYAEQLKTQHGSCYSDLIRENPTLRLPGIGGGEVSLRTLVHIIEARMEEIIEAVYYEIEQSGYAEELHAGIVITGAGANLGHLTEFIEYKTGKKVRKGEPIYLAPESGPEMKHVAYAAVTGMLAKSAEKFVKLEEESPILEPVLAEEATEEHGNTGKKSNKQKNPAGRKRNIFGNIPGLIKDNIPDLFKDYFNPNENTN